MEHLLDLFGSEDSACPMNESRKPCLPPEVRLWRTAGPIGRLVVACVLKSVVFRPYFLVSGGRGERGVQGELQPYVVWLNYACSNCPAIT